MHERRHTFYEVYLSLKERSQTTIPKRKIQSMEKKQISSERINSKHTLEKPFLQTESVKEDSLQSDAKFLAKESCTHDAKTRSRL